jgi:hypothetical protein
MNNKENLQYFECSSMRGLYNEMKGWQEKHQKRLLSTDIQQDGELFTCIALTNPSEVIICGGNGGSNQADVFSGFLQTR